MRYQHATDVELAGTVPKSTDKLEVGVSTALTNEPTMRKLTASPFLFSIICGWEEMICNPRASP